MFLIANGVSAQTPSDDWRTIETQHFRIHFPAEYEAWATRVASRIESIRDAVVAEVGYAAPQKVEVLVVNPEGLANGAAFPLLDRPRLVLFAASPAPDDVIGEFSDWIELLLVHEVAHLEHLLRPSRNPMMRLLSRWLPVGPVGLNSPRWVSEGYATVIEGRLTGSGRPSSSIRASILRKWAESGRLPTYSQLNSDRRFLGMSMAYLAGSAFLEWLEARGGEGSLRNLWARMSARQRRSFDEAFQGVFGDSPQRLYGRFAAELTERAVNVNRETVADLREGTLWQETAHSSGDPAVSPDGKQIALVLRNDKSEAKLVVLSSGEATEEKKKYEERIAKILRRDPQDVAPVRRRPLTRKPAHTLELPLRGNIASPRWLPDGRSIVFSHRAVIPSGDRRHDLYRWTPASGELERLTYGANVHSADPIDATQLVAVRSVYGFSQLVRIDLSSRSILDLTPPSIDRIYAHPRVRDGRLAYVVHNGTRWQLAIRPVDGGEETIVATPEANVATPEWSRQSDEVYAALSSGGLIDIYAIGLNGSRRQVTRVSGAAVEPAPSPDGRLFFMSLEPDGFNVREIDAKGDVPPRIASTRSLVPALPPQPSTPVAFVPANPAPSRPYGFGPREFSLLLGGNAAPAAKTNEVGFHTGDVVGRLSAMGVIAFGNSDSQRGAMLGATWRGLPVDASLHAFTAREGGPLAARVGSDEYNHSGVELKATWVRHYETARLRIQSGVLAGDRSLAFARAHLGMRQRLFSESVEIGGEGGDVRHLRARARGEGRFGGLRFGGHFQADETFDAGDVLEGVLVGGVATTIVPESAIASRVLEPALESGWLAGESYRGFGATLSAGLLGAFYRRHEVSGMPPAAGIGDPAERVSLAGLEVRRTIPAIALLGIPELDVTLGGARILEGSLDGRTRWWIAVRVSP